MKKRFNKMLAAVLALAMLAGMILIAAPDGSLPELKAYAGTVDTGYCGDGVTWTLDDGGTLNISGSGRIDDWSFCAWDNITCVNVSSDVTGIGEFAFDGCTNMRKITVCNPSCDIYDGECTIPRTCSIWGEAGSTAEAYALKYGRLFNEEITDEFIVESGTIGEDVSWTRNLVGTLTVSGTGETYSYSFYCINEITNAVIGEGITGIEEYAFKECANLKKITINNPSCVIYDDRNTIPFTCSIWGEPGSAAEAYAVKYGRLFNKEVTDDAIIESGSCGDGVTYTLTGGGTLTVSGTGAVGDGAFGNQYYGIKNVIIEDGVTGIGEGAFSWCEELISVTIPDSVTSVGSCAFGGCWRLKSVYIDDLSAWCAVRFSDVAANPLYQMPNRMTALYLNGEIVRELIIPDGVTSIGEYVFAGCRHLNSVTIPDSVTSIGDYAFYECYDLSSVTIPGSVKSIGAGAFGYCHNLSSVTIQNGVESIGVSAFNYCEAMTTVNIPDSVKTIGADAFGYCSNLCSVTIQNGVESIGVSAFEYCDALITVNIPDSVASIESYAFFNCSSLTSVTIGKGLQSIGTGLYYGSFRDCTKLSSVTVSPDNAYFSSEDNVLYDKDKTAIILFPYDRQGEYVIPDTVTAIDPDAFHGCTGITSVTIPGSIKCVETHAFEGCPNLASVTFGDGVETIGSWSFARCVNLTSVTVPDSVFAIGCGAFYDCHNLREITINSPTCDIYDDEDTLPPYAVIFGQPGSTAEEYAVKYGRFFNEEIPADYVIASGACGDNANWTLDFSGNLTVTGSGPMVSEIYDLNWEDNWHKYSDMISSVVIGSGVTSISSEAFYFCTRLASVEIPESVRQIGNYAFSDCTSLASADLPSGLTSIGEDAFHNCTSLSSVTVPAGVADIGWGAFSDCSSLASVTLENGLASIGEYMFSRCDSLTSVTIPDSVTTIGGSAFNGCTSLTSVNIPQGVIKIDWSVFGGCSSLSSVTIPDSVTLIDYFAFAGCSSLSSITIPNSVSYLGTGAFCSCTSLTSVTIPDSVTTMEPYAFSDCTSLASAYIGSGIDHIQLNSFDNCPALTYVSIPDSVSCIDPQVF